MTLLNEAAYLYVYSKKLHKVMKRIRILHQKVQKHLAQHTAIIHPQTKEKYRQKHQRINLKLHHLSQQQQELVKKIHHHNLAFLHALQQEQKMN